MFEMGFGCFALVYTPRHGIVRRGWATMWRMNSCSGISELGCNGM